MPLEQSEFASYTASIPEIDELITETQSLLAPLPQSHPSRPSFHFILAMSQLHHSTMLPEKQHLDQSILHFTRAILLQVPSRLGTKDGTNLIGALFGLTMALFRRTNMYEKAIDVQYCIEYHRYLLGLMPEAFSLFRGTIATCHMVALIRQLELRSADFMTNVKEMLELGHEILAMDDSDLEGLPTFAIERFSTLLSIGPFRVEDGHEIQTIDQLIKCLRKANTRLPHLHPIPLAISACLLARFHSLPLDDNYIEAISILDKLIPSHSCTSDPRRCSNQAMVLATMLATARFDSSGRLDHLEESILRCRALLKTLSSEHPDYHDTIRYLTDLEKIRIDEYGIADTHSESLPQDPEVVDPPSFSNLTASLVKLDAFTHAMADREQHKKAVKYLDKPTSAVDFNEAIKYTRLLLKSVHPTDPFGVYATSVLGHILYREFERTNDTVHLNDSITTLRDVLNMSHAQWIHFRVIVLLLPPLSIRWRLFKDRKDLEELMQLSAVAVNDTRTKVPDRLRVASAWAGFARHFGHSSVTAAFENTLSLIQETLAFAPTLETQHSRLVVISTILGELPGPLDYASHQVHTGQLERAVETLERGRGLLFSEMRGLHTPLDQLRAVDTSLAEKFADINRDLEILTTRTRTISSDVWLNDSGVEAQDRVESLGELVTKQRKLMEERDKLISHIRTLPDFEGFLMAPRFDTLRSAAAHGPVIIINHSGWRSDIIILHHDAPPSIIPTPDDFYDRAKGLSDKLLTTQMQGLESREYNEALSSVLESLYNLVGRPVIQRLHELNVPEQSRIWWCPTSVFCYLPLHAMGPIPSDIGPPRYFLDLFISSYTPSLSALIKSRKPGSQKSRKPSMLLVSQPDASMVQALEEMQTVQAIVPRVATLMGATATPAIVLEHLRDHRFVHIVCHGILEPGKPFESSFILHDGKRLSLLKIFRSQLLNAEFAFLSACHTAQLTDKSPFDETLHLAAAMQYCGFRSVVGTMWAMADTDGPDLARNFYRSLFSGQRQGVHYYERTAEALRDAVLKLRRKRGITLERWVNYVHYGA